MTRMRMADKGRGIGTTTSIVQLNGKTRRVTICVLTKQLRDHFRRTMRDRVSDRSKVSL